jgi:hypothetical protein
MTARRPRHRAARRAPTQLARHPLAAVAIALVTGLGSGGGVAYAGADTIADEVRMVSAKLDDLALKIAVLEDRKRVTDDHEGRLRSLEEARMRGPFSLSPGAGVP